MLENFFSVHLLVSTGSSSLRPWGKPGRDETRNGGGMKHALPSHQLREEQRVPLGSQSQTKPLVNGEFAFARLQTSLPLLPVTLTRASVAPT